ncbi:MAG: PSD1 and planctomycete cytochrome C domain-containing protein [Planctomycetaceae bacterium]
MGKSGINWHSSGRACHSATLLQFVSVLAACTLFCWPSPAADDGEHFFESEIRPILVTHCIACHGAGEQNGSLRLDSRDAILRGGDSGPAAIADAGVQSLLISAVTRSGDLAMPPDESLSARQIESLKKWVAMGLPWPATVPTLRPPSESAAAEHWAFQPVVVPEVPPVDESATVRNPIDAFVLRKLADSGLTPSDEADRRTLIRRLSYSMTGLPPSPQDVADFAGATPSRSYEDFVEQLLASPQYGEHWARHWLDVARYSDTKGYVYAREERFWVHAWKYRDWVVNALNEDMPYDRFLLLQIAADQTKDRRQSDLAAMGFLTVGRRFLGVDRDIIDDRIDVVSRGTLGLTVSCARCHDHKYDPIPMADYYSLYGVFDSSAERYVRLDSADHGDEYEAELVKRQKALAEKMAASRSESSARARSRVRDYLHAQTELHKYPPSGFDQIFQESDLLPAFVRRWEDYLRDARRSSDPVWVPWHRFRDLPDDQFESQAADVVRELARLDPSELNPMVAAAFETPTAQFSEVIDRYAALLGDVDARWADYVAAETDAGRVAPATLPDAAAEQLRRVLYGQAAPCEVPDEPIVHTENLFTTAACTALWQLQGELDRWLIQSATPPEYALILTDRPIPAEPRIFLRGNPVNKGDDVPRRFLTVLSPEQRQPFRSGSGRFELAQKIISPSNPLTARVIVNRIWAHHFGQGLVRTPSDFGLRSETPSHPELLDWLTDRFISEGWSLKSLHRLIVTSAAFRQSSVGPPNAEQLAKSLESDPDNRLLWRMNSRRLTFEEFRDSMLLASSELELTQGGKPQELFNNAGNLRRTLYGLVDRQFLPSILRVFDFANPDLHVPQRAETTVPQQALFFMNDPLVLQRSRSLAESCSDGETAPDIVTAMFQRVLQRRPTTDELRDAVAMISGPESDSQAPRATVADWSYGYGSFDEAGNSVSGFQPLPHFTGESWQGGPAWPDPDLGWVQLSAAGGHPGNDRGTASIRRWTAPRDMTVSVESKIVHEPAAGDGVRAFVVSSTAGLLAQAKVHQSSAELSAAKLDVRKGDTLDFVVDIDAVLNNDQYLWHTVIRDDAAASGAESESGAGTAWDSEADFPTNTTQRLSPAEQLAQVLFCSNEFLFVD